MLHGKGADLFGAHGTVKQKSHYTADVVRPGLVLRLLRRCDIPTQLKRCFKRGTNRVVGYPRQ